MNFWHTRGIFRIIKRQILTVRNFIVGISENGLDKSAVIGYNRRISLYAIKT